MSNTTMSSMSSSVSSIIFALEREAEVSVNSMYALRTASLLAAMGHPEALKNILTAWEGREDALSTSILKWIEVEREQSYKDDRLTVVQRVEDAQEMYLFLNRWEAATEEVHASLMEWVADVECSLLEDEQTVRDLEAYRDKFPLPEEEQLLIIANPRYQRLEAVLARRAKFQAAVKAAPTISWDAAWKRWLITFPDGSLSVRVSRKGDEYTVKISGSGKTPEPGAAIKFYGSDGHLVAIGTVDRPEKGKSWVFQDKAGHGALPGGRWEVLFFTGGYAWYLDPENPDDPRTHVHVMDYGD